METNMLGNPLIKASVVESMSFICSKLLQNDYDDKFIRDYLEIVRKTLRSQMKELHENSRRTETLSLTIEEKKAVVRLQNLREREILGYHKALGLLERFLKKVKKSLAFKALQYCKEAEKSWKNMIEEMSGFILTNLSGRGLQHIF